MSAGKWTIGPETLRMIKLGHPWVLADNFTKHWPEGQPGQLVELTSVDGDYIASALLDPHEKIVARILATGKMRLDRDWLKKRLTAAIRLRANHIDLADTDAYRLVNAEGDGLPGLTVDRYADQAMLQIYCGGWNAHLQTITGILAELLHPAGIYEKTRPRNTRELEAASASKRYGKLLYGTPATHRHAVRENSLAFLVSLETGLNSGLFLDQRKNRRDLITRVNNKRVLNLFSYTGAFSVAAASAGARMVTSVDASPGYTEWNKANFEANRINPKKHEFLVGDCMVLLSELARQKKQYDIIIMDPPSFSTTAQNRFTTRGGTADIVASALPLLSAGGLMITSSNHQKVDISDYLKELRRGALQAGSGLQVISLSGQPEDFPYPVTFPEGRYLKYAVCVKTD